MERVGDHLRSLNGPVLITGHTGFKGTWLSLLFENLKIPTVGLSLPATHDSLYVRAQRGGKIPEFFGDITSLEYVEKVFNQVNPSCVIHLAAQSLVLPSYKNPISTFGVNVMGTANILEVATQYPSVHITACVTSDKVYENSGKSQSFSETDKIGGKDPYSASKSAAESVITAWRNLAKERNGSNVLSYRAGNVIGGGDTSQDRLIPDIIRKIYFAQELVIRNQNATRPWQHVLDPLNGYILGIEHCLKIANDQTKAFNFGPDEPSMSVNEILVIAGDFFKDTKLSFRTQDLGKIEELNLSLDSYKANCDLGWLPKYNQRTAVIKTFEWWKSNLEKGESASMLCENDIKDFIAFNNS